MSIFIDNKYTKCYNSIISNAQARITQPNTYYEKHHILPKSLGGTDENTNIVKLTAREHFICHWVLTKMTAAQPKHKMIYALNGMKRKGTGQPRYETPITGRVYAKLKEQFGKIHSQRVISDENRANISAGAKRRDPATRKHSEESKRKIGASKLGKKRKPFSAEWLANISKSLQGHGLGIKHSEERRRKNSEVHKGISNGPMSVESKKKLSDSKKGKRLHVDPITGRRHMAFPHQLLP